MKTINTCAEFLAYALAIEEEATERYTVFAEQMETTNNPEVAALFREMARLESEHAHRLEVAAEGESLPAIDPWELDFGDEDPPEAVDYSATHYLMTPYQALTLVLKAEQRAVDFFQRVAEGNGNDDMKQLAAEYAAEEREHVEKVAKWRNRYPPPDDNWDDDPDPPNELE
ncbi:MAG: rubrerythrin [marine bacterium B5-7]|nr:MAG: rubrerythrin [marine bacterium B5-7]